MRLKVVAQAIEVLGDFPKGERGVVIGAVDADDNFAEFLQAGIGGAHLTAQFPVLFQS